MDSKQFCRLCFNSKENMLNIFDKTGIELNISNILSKHFWFEVIETDELSKSICKECWQCVDEFNRFYNKVKDIYDKIIENKLETWIVKTEQATADETQCNTDVIGTVIQSPLFIPCESINFTKNDNKNYDRKESKPIVPIKRKRCVRSTIKSKVYKKRLRYQSANEISKSHLENVAATDIISVDTVKSEITLKDELESDAVVGDTTEMNSIEKDIDLPVKCKNIPEDTEVVKSCKERKLKTKTNPDTIKQNKLQLIEVDEKIRQFCSMKCELCDYKFDTFLTAKQHYRTSHKINGYLRCCERKLSRRGRVLDHIEIHINPNAFRCDICDKSYVDKASIKSHLESHLPEELRPYKCSECSKTFAMNCKLLQHKRLRHFREEDKKFHCIHCDKSFVTNSFLTIHIRGVHESTYTQICDFCAKVFKTKQSLNEHLRQHVGEEPVKLQCNLCGAWLKHKNSLRKHMYRHKETPQICSICNKEAPSRHALRSHMRYVHSERTHACTMCDKKFKKTIELQEHLATHTGENLYTCPYCPRTFKSNANMHSHRKKNHPVEWQEDRNKRINPS